VWNSQGGDFGTTIFSSNTIGAIGATFNENHYKWSIDPSYMETLIYNPSKNYGFMLKSASEGTATYKKFYSGDNTDYAGYSPLLAITYYSNSRLGLESYWSYHQNALADGTNYVNLGTGNNIVQLTDFAVSGRGKSALSFVRTYNSKGVEDSPFGRGWSHTGGETVTERLNDRSVLYTENDGTVHVFNYNSTTNSYTSPPGKYLTLTKVSNGIYEITDKYGNKSRFKQVYHDPYTSGYYLARIEYEEDRNGNRILYTYDSSGRLTSITDASGRKLTLTYGYGGRVSQITFEGKKYTFLYDFDGNLKESRKFLDATNYVSTYYDYSADGLLSSIIDANGQRTVFNYSNGFLSSVEQPPTSGTSVPIVTYNYDIYNYTATVTDPNGGQTKCYLNNNYIITEIVDEQGQATRYSLDANYNPVQITDPKGNVTYYTYDSKGNLTSITDPKGNTTTYTYDQFSQRLTVTDANGTTIYEYNQYGDLISETNPLGHKTTYQYDSYGNLTSMTLPDGTVETYSYDDLKNYIKTVTDPLGNTATTVTDSMGNIISETDPKGNTTQYSYDDRNLLKSVTDADGKVTSYEYDANGNLTKVINALGKVKSYSYNGQNQVIQSTNSLNQITSYEYDLNGNLTMLTKPSGARISYTYDSIDQLTSVRVNGVDKWSYAYDANGNIASVTDVQTGQIKSYSYDANDNLKTVSKGTHQIGYAFNASNEVTSTTVTVGNQTFTQDYGRDQLNRLTSLSRNNVQHATFDYNNVGLLEKVTYSNGITNQWSYDTAKRLQTLSIQKGSNTLYSYTYGYDQNGNITSIVSNTGNTTYEYDKLNQLTKEQLPDGTIITYSYDAAGNRTGKAVSKDGNQTATQYSYNDANQLISVDGYTFTYDANGNLSKDNQFIYVFNELDQLIQVKQHNGQVIAQYGYDEEGRRISKTVNGATTYYHYDGERVLYETDENDQIVAEYTYNEMGHPVTMTRNGQTYYYILNYRGDVVALADANGAIVASYTYDAYGNILSQSGTLASVNPYRYAGYRYDEETGLYYLMARYYNPKHGNFISIDPHPGDLDNPISQNGYTYANNNPVMFIDPNGEIAVLIPPAVLAAAIAVLGAGLVYYAIETLEAVWKLVKESIAKVKNEPKYKNKYEVHHIVAQTARKAQPARDVLKRVGIGVNHKRNLVSIKTGLHRRLHTNKYYETINDIMNSAYSKKYSYSTNQLRVFTALDLIKAWLLSKSFLSPF
jgi:RHS repeat-associated protein